nr:TPA_inf: MER3 [Testicularia cyperi]
MLSEDFSFDSLARQYGLVPIKDAGSDLNAIVQVNSEISGQLRPQLAFPEEPNHDLLSSSNAIEPQTPFASYEKDLSVMFDDGHRMTAALFDFDRAQQQGLVETSNDLQELSTADHLRQDFSTAELDGLLTTSNLSTSTVDTSLAEARLPIDSTNSCSLSSMTPNMSSVCAAAPLVVEPEPGHRVTLVPVSSLPALYRSLFGFPFFNAVQSVCLPTLLHNTDNVVVSAPTGSGKTVLFELALLRMLQHEPESAKAVYLAPTKALCAEKTRDWTRRFGSLSVGVIELTGDSVYGLHMARKSRIIVTTPEKWDSLTRRWDEQQLVLSNIRLLLVDEVHILNEPVRGARLEVVVTRTKLHGQRVRFVAVSATVPNLDDVASWIGRATRGKTAAVTDSSEEGRAKTFQFGEAYRPCPLDKFVYGFPKAKDEFAFQSYLNHKLHDLIAGHAAGRPCLVFVATRRATVQAATVLVDAFKKSREDDSTRGSSICKSTHQYDRQTRESVQASLEFDDANLQSLANHGVAFHHAGLSLSDRRKVEQAFLAERLSVLCCTTTLATGVNLPAYCVVVRGTKQFDGQWTEMADLDLIQMMGRAGRPQFDRRGVAVVMCEDTVQQRYRDLVGGTRDMESGLAASLVEHVNAEIGLRGRSTSAEMERWIRESFLWTRIQRNPTHYLSRDEGIGLDSNEAILEHLCSGTIRVLRDTGLIEGKTSKVDPCGAAQGEFLLPTAYGDIMSRFFLRHSTMLALMRLELGAGTRAILEAISEAEEFAALRIRQGEKAYLQALRSHSEIRFVPRQLLTGRDKVFLLIQATLSAVNVSHLLKSNGSGGAGGEVGQGPFSDVRMIFAHAPRIVKAVMDVAIFRRDGHACKAALDLARSISARAWDGSPAMLRQIEQVGERSIKALAAAGLSTWESLAGSSASRIEMILNRNPPFGRNVIKAAKSVPRIGLEVLQKATRARLRPDFDTTRSRHTASSDTESVGGVAWIPDSAVEIVFDVKVTVENRSTCMMKSKTSKLPLSVCILTLTDEHEYIDFRRMPLWRLEEGRTFTLRVRLDSIRTHVLVYAACDEIAGTMVVADLLPADMSGEDHRTKLVRARASDMGRMGSSQCRAHEQSANNDILADEVLLDREPSHKSLKRCKHKCKKACRHPCCQKTRPVETADDEPRLLDDHTAFRQSTLSGYTTQTFNSGSGLFDEPAIQRSASNDVKEPATMPVISPPSTRGAEDAGPNGSWQENGRGSLLAQIDRLTGLDESESEDMPLLQRAKRPFAAVADTQSDDMSIGASSALRGARSRQRPRTMPPDPATESDRAAETGLVSELETRDDTALTNALASQSITNLAECGDEHRFANRHLVSIDRPLQRRFLQALDQPAWLYDEAHEQR